MGITPVMLTGALFALAFTTTPKHFSFDDALREVKEQLAELRQESLAKAEASQQAKKMHMSASGESQETRTSYSSDSLPTAYDCSYMCGYGHVEWEWKFWDSTCSCDPGFSGPCCDGPTECGTDAAVMCGASRYQIKSKRCEDVTYDGPLSNEWQHLPAALQGVFWLTDQGDSSALMSFGASGDGGGLSSGKLSDGPVNYEIRVAGDKVWSFMDKASSWELVDHIDLVYKFRMDSATNPTKGTIDPSSPVLGLTLGPRTKWLLRFDVELVPFGTCTGRGTKCYPDSVTWARPSSIAGFDGGYYELVQVDHCHMIHSTHSPHNAGPHAYPTHIHPTHIHPTRTPRIACA